MKTRLVILSALSACLLATQAQAIQIKPSQKWNVGSSISTGTLIGKLTNADITRFVSNISKYAKYASSNGKKPTITGGYTNLQKYPLNNNNKPGQSYGDTCRKDCDQQVSVPEPSIIALLGSGLLLLGFSQHRKSR